MRIGIDLDNVVVNTTETVLNYLAERGAPRLTLNDMKVYWIEKNFPPEYSLLVAEAFESRRMWKNIQLIEGAKRYIKKLYDDGDEIYFVTSSLPENLDKKIKHLTRNLDFLPEDYIVNHTINIRKKQLLKLDILVDDCYDNLSGDKEYTSILFCYPWNNDITREEDMWSASTWGEVYDCIKAIKKERARNERRLQYNQTK